MHVASTTLSEQKLYRGMAITERCDNTMHVHVMLLTILTKSTCKFIYIRVQER